MVPLGPTEWLLMRCIWDLGAANPSEVSEHVKRRYGRPGLLPSTVGILLARLVEKGYLRSSRGPVQIVGRGRPPHVYTPAIPFDTALRVQVERFLDEHQLGAEMVAELLESLFSKPEKREKPG
jgi:predicted transcriptional regulator